MLPEAFQNRTACCFTGHRARYLTRESADALQARLERCMLELVELGVVRFLTGGADGFDTLAAETALRCRTFAPNVRLTLALPSRTQADYFDEAMRLRYERIRAAADEVRYASDYDNSVFSLHARNRYLVEHADCCVAYLYRPAGGTLYTVHYALERGLPVYNLAEAAL